MIRRTLLTTLALLLPAALAAHPAATATAAPPQPAAALPGTPMCFVETGYCLHGRFLLYWRVNGGAAQFGYPVTPELTEGGRTVQYTERARSSYTRTTPCCWACWGRNVTAKRTDTPFRSGDGGKQWTLLPRNAAQPGRPLSTLLAEPGRAAGLRLPDQRAVPGEEPRRRQDLPGPIFRAQPAGTAPRSTRHPREIQLGLLGSQAYAQVYGNAPPLKPDPTLAPDPVSLAALRLKQRDGRDLQVVRTIAAHRRLHPVRHHLPQRRAAHFRA